MQQFVCNWKFPAYGCASLFTVVLGALLSLGMFAYNTSCLHLTHLLLFLLLEGNEDASASMFMH